MRVLARTADVSPTVGLVTTPSPREPRRRPQVLGIVLAGVIASYALVVLAMEAPDVLAVCVVAAVVVLDVRLVLLAARHRSRGVAWRYVAVALVAALAQAIWVCVWFASDVVSAGSDGLVRLGSAPGLATLLAAGLVVRRRSRPYAWAVLMGSIQGFVATFVVLLGALVASIGAD